MQLCILSGMSNTPTMPHPIPEPLADAIAARLRAIAEPMRIRLLDYLREDGASIQGALNTG